MTRAVQHLVQALELTEEYDLECGALYHAVHGLMIYRDRMYGPAPNSPAASVQTPIAAK